jgi:hypothetical protein
MAQFPPYVNIFHNDEFCRLDRVPNTNWCRPTHYSIYYHTIVRLDEVEHFKHLVEAPHFSCKCQTVYRPHTRIRLFTKTRTVELDVWRPPDHVQVSMWEANCAKERRRVQDFLHKEARNPYSGY